jgi:GT2 family glycosyltransferase
LKDFEVIVVDDDGTNERNPDDTKGVIQEFHKSCPQLNLYYFRQDHQGQGIARNFGIAKAKGKIILFLGDDQIPRFDCLSEHARFHLRYPEENDAVLGFTAWHPELTLTSYMKWLTDGSSILGKFGGHQFAYEKLQGKIEADYNFFYTSNISLKKSLLQDYAFDPDFSGYGWEDIELGYRLTKQKGLKIYYNSQSLVYHYHPMTEEGLAEKMRSIGKAAWVIHRKYPELGKVPGKGKEFIFKLLSNKVSLSFFSFLRHISQDKWVAFYFYALSKKYFLEGLHSNGSDHL